MPSLMPSWLRFSVLIAMGIAFTLAYPGPLAAAPNKAKAQKLLIKGDKALQVGDAFMADGKVEEALEAYESALDLYNAAYKAYPNPQIYFVIALAEQKLGRYLESIRHYEEMIARSENPSKELVARVQEAIAAVRKNLAALTLTVEQDGAIVRVDGEEIGKTPLAASYYMEPGKHTYSVSLPGHAPFEESLNLEPGQEAKRVVKLVALATDVGSPGAKGAQGLATPKEDGATTAPKLPLVLGFGGAGAMVLAATITGLRAKSRHDRFTDESLSDAARQRAQKTGKRYQIATDVFLAGGLLAAGYGTYYYFATYRNKGHEAERTGEGLQNVSVGPVRWVMPYTGTNGAGIVMGGTFW